MDENLLKIMKSAIAPHFDQNWPFHKNEKLKFHETFKNGFLGIKNII